MSLLSPSHTFYSEKVRYAAGLGQAGRYRINVQIGTEQYHVTLHLPETRTFNEILDDLQPMFNLTEYQRMHTRIFLQTLLGETEVLVNSRPNFATERNIDYVAIPANMKEVRIGARRRTRSCTCLVAGLLFLILILGTFIAVDFLVLRPQLVTNTRKAVLSPPQGQTPDNRPPTPQGVVNATPAAGSPDPQAPVALAPAALGPLPAIPVAPVAPVVPIGTTPAINVTPLTTVDVTTPVPKPGNSQTTGPSTPSASQSPQPTAVTAPPIGLVPTPAVLPTTGLMAKT